MKDEVFGDLTRIDGGGWMLGKDPREFLAEQGIDPSDPDYKSKMMNVDVSDLMRGMVGDAAFGEVEKMLGGAGSRGGPGKKGKAADESGGTGETAPRAVGFSFHCTWDDEHGCGVLTHDGNVVAVGESDTVFDEGNIDYVQKEQKGRWG